MKKIEKSEVEKELRRIYELKGGHIGTEEWSEIANISTDTVRANFGTWSAAWEAIGVDTTSINYKREQVIIDLQRAFGSIKDAIKVEDLIRLSGHTIPHIMKYFDSTDHALKMARIDLNKKFSREELINDFKEIYNKIGRVPNEKEIKEHTKYSRHTFIRYFGSIDAVVDAAGLEREEVKLKVSEEELLEELKVIQIKLNKTDITTQDAFEHGKFGIRIYDRVFGSFSNALKKIGAPKSTGTKVESKCSICGEITSILISHISKEHPEEFKKEEEKVVAMFKDGASNREIASKSDIFRGSSSVSRVIKKYLTPEEIEALRKNKIAKKLKNDYAEGKYDWVNDLNRQRNMTPESKEKNSVGLKKSYENKDAWNKGLTKETDERLLKSGEHISRSMKILYDRGTIEKKVGPNNTHFEEDRGIVARRYRLGLDFTAEQRGLIKKRADYKCQDCGISQEQLEENHQTLECDHIISIFKGGENNWEINGQALCPKCHNEKTERDIC